MNHVPRLRSWIGVVAFALVSAGASGQAGPTARLHCQAVGGGAPEALGDREGHAIAAGTYSCRVEGGPGDGGIVTGTAIFEWDKGQAVLLSGMGINRKPGAVSAYQHLEGKQSLVMTDGKVSGFTGSGRGRYTLATGSMAAMAGKTYSFTFSSTGPGQFTVDLKSD